MSDTYRTPYECEETNCSLDPDKKMASAAHVRSSLSCPVELEGTGDSVLSQVSACLDDALRLFQEGKPDEACLCLVNANSLLASYSLPEKPGDRVTPISAVNKPVQLAVAEEEQAPRALAAIA